MARFIALNRTGTLDANAGMALDPGGITPIIGGGIAPSGYDPGWIEGTNNADVLHGTDLHDEMYGYNGDDQIFGYGDSDWIRGGWGADQIDGGEGTFDISIYDDSPQGVVVDLALGRGFFGTANGDTLVNIEDVAGSYYNDVLIGNGGNNYLHGLDGDDQLRGGGGADGLIGGTGIDAADYGDSTAAVTVNLATGRGFGGTAEGDTLDGIEDLLGSAHADTLVGDDGSNYLHGAAGHDLLKGGGGDDYLEGVSGDDTLKGGGGADTLVGGAGTNTASYEGSSAGVAVSLQDHFAALGDAEGDALYNIANLTGSIHTDNLFGDDNRNVLNGMNGDDILRGGGDADTLNGGEGADSLLGDAGFDFLSGGNGADVLNGGAGQDTMFGGAGNDRFAWNNTSETGVTIPTMDLISDFNFAQGDRIDLSRVDANVFAVGNQAFTFIGQAGFTGAPGEVNYVYGKGETIIQLQTGTSTDIEGGIRLSGIHTPDASWFSL